MRQYKVGPNAPVQMLGRPIELNRKSGKLSGVERVHRHDVVRKLSEGRVTWIRFFDAM